MSATIFTYEIVLIQQTDIMKRVENATTVICPDIIE